MLRRRNRYLSALAEAAYAAMLGLAYPFAWLYAVMRPAPKSAKSVLHVSYMVHVPWHMTRILRKYGYPPDKQEKATRTVLEQAEALSGE